MEDPLRAIAAAITATSRSVRRMLAVGTQAAMASVNCTQAAMASVNCTQAATGSVQLYSSAATASVQLYSSAATASVQLYSSECEVGSRAAGVSRR